jgi:hypothetical protein
VSSVRQPVSFPFRLTRLPGAFPDDWPVVLDGKKIIGRIYKSPNRVGDPWFWGLNTFRSSAANSGYARRNP